MIYFDSAATTIPSSAAIDEAKKLIEIYGNPSSVHSVGIAAKRIVDGARKTVAKALYVKPEEIIFTSCGSESNNQALNGLAKLRSRRSKRIITSNSEHPSVSAPLAALEEDGFEIVRIPTVGGRLDIEILEAELSKGAAFAAIMLANNETGALYDIPAVRRAIDKSGCGAYLHCDAVQGFLKTADKKIISKNCDTASISAHKIGGFKGVGALYVKSGIKMPPFVKGGGQESGFRSGTENVLGIASFAAACEGFDDRVTAHISELYAYLTGLLKENPDLTLHIPEKHVDSILLVSVHGVKSEVMLNALNLKDICVSAGSACSARKGITHAMAAYGMPKDMLESAIRISIGAHNTKEECVILAETIKEIQIQIKR